MSIQGYPQTNWQDFIEASTDSSTSTRTNLSNRDLLKPADRFVKRHIGPRSRDVTHMLDALGLSSLEELVNQAVPHSIRMDGHLNLEPPRSETAVLNELRQLAAQNKLFRSFIGMGYTGTVTPSVIQRNILENPGWYTQYTPYQPEISQGRLEALINFQTMVSDLTGLEIANASLLDEGTAAAEAMTMCQRAMPRKSKANTFFVSELCHPQTIAVVQTRAEPLGINVVVGSHDTYDFAEETFGVLLQYPTTAGDILDYGPFAEKAHENNALVVVAADILSLVLLRPPGEFGADVVVGSTQRFGVPLGYGGPHAAYMACRDAYKRAMPGRLVGVSIDARGNKAYRLSLQTREQHIRREKATSNVCTAQALLAVMASFYAVFHGPKGLRAIAQRLLEHPLKDKHRDVEALLLIEDNFVHLPLKQAMHGGDHVQRLRLLQHRREQTRRHHSEDQHAEKRRDQTNDHPSAHGKAGQQRQPQRFGPQQGRPPAEQQVQRQRRQQQQRGAVMRQRQPGHKGHGVAVHTRLVQNVVC